MSVVANIAVNVDSSNAVSKLKQVQTQSQQTERAVEGLSRAFGGLAAAFGAGFALTKVIADVKELDTNLRRLGTVGVDVAKISPALSKLSDELGGVASKAELAAASYQAASAGFSDTAGNINILRAATKAAVGGLADTQAVTEVLVKTLNSYGMSGNQATKVTDSISKAVELGNQEWSDYTSQLGRVASIAALAGVSLDEVNAFISSATLNGATAEIAFTGLGATLSQILTPTKESQEAAAKLGIQWNLAGLNAKGFSGLMDELAAAMDKDKEAAARMVGPIEAARGAFAAASKDGSDFKNILEQIGGAAGKTDADFQTMKGSLENTLKALDTSFKNLSEALGIAFGPTVVIAVQDITKAVNGFADFMATVPQPVMNTAGELVKLIAQMLLLQKAIQAIIALRAAFIGAMVGMTGATVAATGSVSGLASALLGLAGIGIITVGVNYVVTQVGAISGNISSINASEAAGTSGGLAAQLKGKSAAERKKMMAAAQKNLANDQKLAQRLQLQMKAQEAASTDKPDPSQKTELLAAQARIKTNQARIRAIQSTPVTAGAPPRKPSAVPDLLAETPTGGATGGGKKGKEKQERESQLADILAANGLFRSQQTIAARIAVAEVDRNKTEVARLQHVERSVQLLHEAAAIERSNVPLDEKQAQLRGVQDKLAASTNQYEREIATEKIAQIEAANEIITGVTNQIAVEEQLTEKGRAQALLEQEIAKLKKDGVLITDEQINAYKNANAELDKTKEKVAAIKQQQEMLDNLYDGIAGTIAGGVGGAIDAISGNVDNLGETLQSLAADILKAVGKMLIFYALAQAFGALGGDDGVGVFSFLAKAFGGGKASGGPVAPNTNYIVGENGPELLSMGGSGGKVYSNNDSKMQSAMSRYSRGARGEGVIAGSGGAESGGGAAAAGPMVVDVRYSVERINDVEYVTASAFQAGMRQAAQQGAAQGEQRTLRRLQQSPGTRKRVGM